MNLLSFLLSSLLASVFPHFSWFNIMSSSLYIYFRGNFIPSHGLKYSPYTCQSHSPNINLSRIRSQVAKLPAAHLYLNSSANTTKSVCSSKEGPGPQVSTTLPFLPKTSSVAPSSAHWLSASTPILTPKCAQV